MTLPRPYPRILWPNAGQPGTAQSPPAPPRGIRPLLAGAAVLLLAAGGLFWLNQPAPASAEQVLDRAARVKLLPNQAAHRVYQMVQQNRAPATALGDTWVQGDAESTIIRTALAFRGS